MMLKTYQGHFREGRFISPDITAIPNGVMVYVTILEDVKPPIKALAQKQNEGLKRFFATIDGIDDEPITDEDLMNFKRNRVKFNRELDL